MFATVLQIFRKIIDVGDFYLVWISGLYNCKTFTFKRCRNEFWNSTDLL